MLRTALLFALAIAVALVGGAASVWYALGRQDGVGAVTVGGWTAYPDIGTPSADPYTAARVAREGLLALGRAEGLAFSAQRDSNGEPLLRQCRYVLEGPIPAARFWTLHAEDPAGQAVPSGSRRANALHSQALLRLPGDALSMSVGNQATPGNWLAVAGSGAMALVLTLYDTPVASQTGVADLELPQILKTGCDA